MNRLKRRQLPYHTLTLLYIATLTTLSLIPISGVTPPPFPHFDKVVHIGFYMGLNTLLLLCAHSPSVRTILTTSSITIAYGVAIEVVQHFVGRHFDTGDIAANSIGAILGALLFVAGKYLIASKIGGRRRRK